MRRAVEGARPANADIGASCGDQRLGLWQNQPFGRWRRGRGEIHRQPVALVGVEHGEAFQKWDAIGLASVALRPPALLVRHEAVGVDHGGAALALADVAAKPEGLAKGKPALTGETTLRHRAPQDQHIDPGIAAAADRVAGEGKGSLHRRGAPGLNPGDAAGLQFGDDPGGDFLIQAGPVPAGPGARRCV